ncbi:hypothetical protein PAECIP111890_02100 [Paenibacillus sp. JJ-223]|nr:hypothetical protein PAECIP111890_02100 [Paenibacillus sp. JJ-223]
MHNDVEFELHALDAYKMLEISQMDFIVCFVDIKMAIQI